jgi:hypothetical protein
MAKEPTTTWHIHAMPVIDVDRTDIHITKYDPKTKRTYDIRLCPTVSLSVFLPDNEAKLRGGNHHIYGILQVNNDNDFDTLWNALTEMLKNVKTTNAALKYMELSLVPKPVSEATK